MPGSIDKKQRNGKWRVRWRDHPRGKQHVRHFAKKGEAEKFLAGINVQQANGTYVPPSAGARSFRDYVEEWQASQVQLRPSTAAQLDTHLRLHILPTFGDMPLRAIERSHVRAWVKERDAHLAASTLTTVFRYLSSILKSAVADRIIPRNPCADVRLPKIDKARVRPLELAQVAALANGLNDRYRAMVWLGVGSGLRISEALGLVRDRIDMTAGTVTVDQQLVCVQGFDLYLGPPKTQASRRTVPLGKSTLATLEAHMDAYPPGDWGLVFTRADGKPIRRSVASRIVSEAAKKNNVPGTFHDLRHTYASLLIGAGESVKVVQARLGHASASETLDTYSHMWPADDQRTRDIIDRALGVATPSE